MRTFIAIELPQEIKNKLAEIQEELKKSAADVKWVEPANIHLTLKFLGEIDDKKQEKIIEIIEDASSKREPFKIEILSVGAFPKIDFPRVIWVDTSQGKDQVKEIALELEEKIAKLGIPKEERSFQSHITLGRVRSGLNKAGLVQELKKLIASGIKEETAFEVTKITLFKSTLTPKGPVYEALRVASLKNA